MGSESQIIPVFVGDTHRTVEMSQMLLKEGVFVQGIRPPTVPKGKSRLRVTVMATHSKADLDAALKSFKKTGKKLKIV